MPSERTDSHPTASRWSKVGLFVTVALAGAGAWISCAPGEVECGVRVNCDALPGQAGGAGGGTGGTGGGTGGTGGGTGGMGGGTGGMGGGTGGTGGAAACPTLNTPVNCAKAPTVDAVEQMILKPQCATAGCHTATGPFQPFLPATEMFKRLVDKPAALQCMTDMYINKTDASKSYFVAKVKFMAGATTITCPSGGAGGTPMPYMKPALSAEDTACVEAYAVALGCK